MDKYCTNCGNEINEQSDFCLKCGKIIKRPIKKNNIINIKENKEILEIVGLIFGVLSFYLSLMLSLCLAPVKIEIINTLGHIYHRIILTFIYVSISLIPATIGLTLSVHSLKKTKNLFSIIGLTSSLIAIVFNIFIIIFILN